MIEQVNDILQHYLVLIKYSGLLYILYLLTTKFQQLVQKEELQQPKPTLGKKLINNSDSESESENNDSPFPQGLDPLKFQLSKDEEKNLSWKSLHSNMLKKYKEKFPQHGPDSSSSTQVDDYDDEIKQLFKKHA